MAGMVEQPAELPPLREEIHCLPGPKGLGGAPTWTLHDPANNRFFRIGWLEFEILSSWSLRLPAKIVEAVRKQTLLQTGEEDIAEFCSFLSRNNLLQVRGEAGVSLLSRQHKAGRSTGWQWLLHNYLFFKIPLFKPDAFLAWLYPYVAWIYGGRFLSGVLLAFVLSLFLLSRQWERFLATFAQFFNWEGLLQYGIALALAKTLHEFGHALTLHRFGCRVPAMGIAFMVMYPMLYTDANEAWKLQDKRQRLAIAFAGIAAELILAVFAALLWSFLADGPVRSAAFLLATSTWIMTLVVNLSPFMRFDGYYLLADWVGVDNLQTRAFAFARWSMRRVLFGAGESAPEILPKRYRWFFVAYAFGTWLYRFFLFLGIALLVYHFCFKLLGIVLMAVEVGWFIVRPIVNELKLWKGRLHELDRRHRFLNLLLLLASAVLLVFPWQTHVSVPAWIKAEQYAEVFLPRAARLDIWRAENGLVVKNGELLAQLSSPELNFESRHSSLEGDALAWQLAYQGMDLELVQRRRVWLTELASASAKQEGIRQQLEQLQIAAPFDGRVLDVNRLVQAGQWLPEGEALFVVVDPASWMVEGFIAEDDLRAAEQAVAGKFYPENPDLPGIPCRVERIDSGGSARIPPLLASAYGGDIAARPGEQREQIPENAVYRIVLRPESPLVRGGGFQGILRGTVRLETPGVSVIERLWARIASVLVRESGF